MKMTRAPDEGRGPSADSKSNLHSSREILNCLEIYILNPPRPFDQTSSFRSIGHVSGSVTTMRRLRPSQRRTMRHRRLMNDRGVDDRRRRGGDDALLPTETVLATWAAEGFELRPDSCR